MRCFFLQGGHIVAVQLIDAESDADAIEQARALFMIQGNKYEAFEVWDRARFLYRFPPEGGT